MQDIQDRLDEKIDKIVNGPGYYDDASVFAGDAAGLKAAAVADGYAEADLVVEMLPTVQRLWPPVALNLE